MFVIHKYQNINKTKSLTCSLGNSLKKVRELLEHNVYFVVLVVVFNCSILLRDEVVVFTNNIVEL